MRKRYIIIGVILIVLLAVRLYLPVYAKKQINKQLDAIDGYSGNIEKVTIQLIRGSIQFHNLKIFEEASEDPSIPIIELLYNDINIHWGALFQGEFVGEVYMDSLSLNLTVTHEEVDGERDRLNLAETLADLMPIRINIFQITNSRISYLDPTVNPPVNIYLSDLFIEAINLQNVENKEDTLPSSVRLESHVMNSGEIIIMARLDVMKEIPEFETEVVFENIDLTQFNDFTEAYADFSINNGSLNLYSEAAAHEGLLSGYVKPIIEDLEIAKTEEDNFLQKAYEGALDAIAHLFKNPDTENIGTRVEFEGRIDNPDVEVLRAVWILLRNAFFESVSKGVEDVIDIEDLQ